MGATRQTCQRWACNCCAPANALVSEGRSFDAESASLCHARDARPGPRRRRALRLPPVSASGLTTPGFWTVSWVPEGRFVSSGKLGSSLLIPESRLIVTAAKWVLEGTRVALEYSHNRDYPTSKHRTGSQADGLFPALANQR